MRNYSKRYDDEHREIRAKKQREYYKKHGDIQRKASNNWKKNNIDRVKEYCHKWYIENKDKKSEWFKKYSIENKNIILEKSRRQRNKKFGIQGTFSEKDFEIKLFNHKFKCFYCGCELDKNNITRDHYIPLCSGGTDTIDNIVPCCKKCNTKKNNKSPKEFIKSMDNHDPSQENFDNGILEGAETRE